MNSAEILKNNWIVLGKIKLESAPRAFYKNFKFWSYSIKFFRICRGEIWQ